MVISNKKFKMYIIHFNFFNKLMNATLFKMVISNKKCEMYSITVKFNLREPKKCKKVLALQDQSFKPSVGKNNNKIKLDI